MELKENMTAERQETSPAAKQAGDQPDLSCIHAFTQTGKASANWLHDKNLFDLQQFNLTKQL